MIQYCEEFRTFSSFFSSDAQRAAFLQFAVDAISDLASSAVSCSQGRNGLGHAFEKIERAAPPDNDLAHVQQLPGCVEKFLTSIVTILTGLQNAGCIRAEDEAHFQEAVLVARQGLEELKGLAGIRIGMTSEMEAEKKDMIGEIEHLKQVAAEADRQREESDRQRIESERQRERQRE
jgi:hypothetical protein